jgi:hypothetical protein
MILCAGFHGSHMLATVTAEVRMRNYIVQGDQPVTKTYVCCLLVVLQEAATPGAACVTSADGSCIVDLAAAKVKPNSANLAANSAFQPSDEGATYSAVITADGHGPLVVPDLPNSGRYRTMGPNKDYVATLVLDRKLVKPGDDLHVTGGGCTTGSHCGAPAGLNKISCD